MSATAYAKRFLSWARDRRSEMSRKHACETCGATDELYETEREGVYKCRQCLFPGLPASGESR